MNLNTSRIDIKYDDDDDYDDNDGDDDRKGHDGRNIRLIAIIVKSNTKTASILATPSLSLSSSSSS